MKVFNSIKDFCHLMSHPFKATENKVATWALAISFAICTFSVGYLVSFYLNKYKFKNCKYF